MIAIVLEKAAVLGFDNKAFGLHEKLV